MLSGIYLKDTLPGSLMWYLNMCTHILLKHLDLEVYNTNYTIEMLLLLRISPKFSMCRIDQL